MRKITSFLLLLAAIVALFGCANPQTEFIEPVKFYYLRNELTYGKADSVIYHEFFEASGHSSDYVYLINHYLEGPQSDSLAHTFPRNVSVVSFQTEAGQAYLELTENFSFLSGMDLTIACACLTKTITELTGASALHISVEDALLDGNQTITMRMEDVLLLDHSAEATTD